MYLQTHNEAIKYIFFFCKFWIKTIYFCLWEVEIYDSPQRLVPFNPFVEEMPFPILKICSIPFFCVGSKKLSIFTVVPKLYGSRYINLRLRGPFRSWSTR